MRDTLQSYKSFFGKLTACLVFSFFVSGCHTNEEPVSVPEVTAKKETTNHIQSKRLQADTIVKTRKKIPGAPVNHSASGILVPDKQANKSRIYDPASVDKNPDSATRSDPFSLPAALRKQQPVTRGKQALKSEISHPEAPLQQPAAPLAPRSQEPYVAGIFDNGKEKLALLHWQQIRGIFRHGEPLGNGYYVKEIKSASVLLYPENNNAGIKPVTLTLQQ